MTTPTWVENDCRGVHRRSSAVTRVLSKSLRPGGGDAGPGLAPLHLGEPSFQTPEPIVAAMQQALAEGYTHYAPPNGDPDLLEALAEYTTATSQRACSTANVAVTHGGSGGLAAVITGLVDAGERVVIPQPTYSLYQDLVEFVGGQVDFCTLDPDWHLDLDQLETVLPGARMLILCNPGNPTGAVIPDEQLRAVGRLLEGTNTLVLVDEAYRDLVYTASFMSALAVDELRERVVVCNTFSKSFAMTGWRLGWTVGSANAIESIKMAHRTFNGGLSAAVQRAALVAITQAEELLRPMVDAYRERRELAVGLLTGSEMLRCHAPEGAFYLFGSYPHARSAVEVVTAVRDRGVLVRPGTEFGPSGEAHLRISYAAAPEVIEVGLRRLDEALWLLHGSE